MFLYAGFCRSETKITSKFQQVSGHCGRPPGQVERSTPYTVQKNKPSETVRNL